MKKRSTNITAITLQKRIFWAIFGLILLLFTAYGYFVSKSITNVLLREEVEESIVMVNSEISRLEFTYLNQKNTVTLDFAYKMGFRDIKNKEFVARKSVLGQQLTLTNEI